MFGTSGAGSHRILFSNPPLRRVFIVSSLGRFGYAVLPLCLLFSIAQGSGSFRTAALASAAFGLGGLLMPVEARLLDRHGQHRVLPLLGGWFTVFLITVWGATHLFQISPGWWILLCALGGAGAPSLGPSMRAQWREATDEPLRSVAYSVDAIVEEILFLVGPLTASAFLAVGHPEHGLLLAAALIALGVVGLCGSPYRPAIRRTGTRASRRHRWIGPLGRPGFVRLAIVMLVAGFECRCPLIFQQPSRLGPDHSGRRGQTLADIACSSEARARGASWASEAAATNLSGRRNTTPMPRTSNQLLRLPSRSPTTRVPDPAYSFSAHVRCVSLMNATSRAPIRSSIRRSVSPNMRAGSLPHAATVHQGPMTSSRSTPVASLVATRGWMNCRPTGERFSTALRTVIKRLVRRAAASPGWNVSGSTTTPRP